MIKIRKSESRGHFDFGWLNTYHSFSFGDYLDPKHMGFRSLRVINEDTIAAATGFPKHSHRDMEIVTYMLKGSLEHKDSMGNGSVISPGMVQRMTAGSGVTHSEYNASKTEPAHLLQIWILPEEKNLKPGYEEKKISQDNASQWRLIASRNGEEGSVTVHQDMKLFSSFLGEGDKIFYELPQSRYAWVQLAAGEVNLNGETLKAGDGAAIEKEKSLQFVAVKNSEILLFDLA